MLPKNPPARPMMRACHERDITRNLTPKGVGARRERLGEPERDRRSCRSLPTLGPARATILDDMCGRMGKIDKDVQALIDELGPDGYYRRILTAMQQGGLGFNLAPTEQIAFVAQPHGVETTLVGRWGLEPGWVRDPAQVKSTLFNARAESAAEKPSFRDALRRSRCVVPVSGFYEWQPIEGAKRKQPYWIARQDGRPLIIAGLYALHEWGASFTLLTTSPNALMAPIHDRMPVILDPADVDRWLDPELTDPAAVQDLLRPCPDEWLTARALTRPVGDWEPE